MINAVLFDIDGVLLDSFDANYQFYCNFFTKAGYTPPTRDEYRAMFHLTMVDVIGRVAKPTTEEEFERIRQIGLDRVNLYPFEMVKMPSDAVPTVRSLVKRYALGMVTSRIKGNIYNIPQLAQLEDLFQIVIAFEDTTEHKPHPEPLLQAASKLNIAPNHIAYVGDAQTDLLAGKAAGMKTILYQNTEVAGADGYIATFSELPKMLTDIDNLA